MNICSIDLIVPHPGEAATPVELAAWLAENGEFVQAGEPILELLTEGILLQLDAPASGYLEQLIMGSRKPVLPGDQLGRIHQAFPSASATPRDP